MSEKTMRIAAIGTGGIWGAHARNLAALGGNEVVAVCDVNEANRERAAAALGARAYADIESLFQQEEQIDAAIACTPATVRKSVVEAATRYKVPLFVEKPPAFSLDDARAIVQFTGASDVPVVVGFMYRYLPAVDRLRELIGGRNINLVQSSFLCPAATEWNIPGWFYIKEKSGGHVLDQAIHVMDLLRFIAGDIVQVQTYGNNLIKPKTDEFTVEDSSSTNLRFASGASGGHIHSWAHHEFTGQATFIGERFRLTLHLDTRLSGFVDDVTIDETFPAPPEGCSHHYEEMRAFLAAVHNRDFSTLRSPFADAAQSLATVLAMNKSIECERPVTVEKLS